MRAVVPTDVDCCPVTIARGAAAFVGWWALRQGGGQCEAELTKLSSGSRAPVSRLDSPNPNSTFPAPKFRRVIHYIMPRFFAFSAFVFAACVAGLLARQAPAQEVLDGIAAVVNQDVITFSQVRELVGAREKAGRETLKG